jgi:3-deoxy-D-manno-octulosonic-acid transferase
MALKHWLIFQLYQAAANLLGPPAVLAASLKGRFGGHWRERLGWIPVWLPASRPRIWIHSASVGEVRSAEAVMLALLAQSPEVEISLSAVTPAGLATAAQLWSGHSRVKILAAPLDFWGAPQRFIDRLRPSVLVIMETELWPNLIRQARRAGLVLILAAARLTERSFQRYRLVRSSMADLLGCFDLIAPLGPREGDLFIALGAPAERLAILGNPKYDRLAAETASPAFAAKKTAWATRFWGSGPRGRLLVAGSTHPGEEAEVLRASEKLLADDPALTLLLAPRHLNRVDEVLALTRSRRLTAIPASQLDQAPQAARARVVVLDSLGQLTVLYALADLALVGGSLLPGLTGHNPLEPAAAATPMLFGRHMASFASEAAGLLLAGGARETALETLAEDLARCLHHPTEARQAARAARLYLETRSPAGPALAQAILSRCPH